MCSTSLSTPTPPPPSGGAAYFTITCEKVHREVPAIEGLVQHKNATIGAPGVGLVTFFQDRDCVLHMLVQKVNPEVGPI